MTAAQFTDTDVTCPGCGQEITCVKDGSGWYSECGGEGNGGCDVWIDGNSDCEAAHERAIALMPS
jgi:hypothetical protein